MWAGNVFEHMPEPNRETEIAHRQMCGRYGFNHHYQQNKEQKFKTGVEKIAEHFVTKSHTY